MSKSAVDNAEFPGARSKTQAPRVAIIGAGAGGLCMGAALRRLGVDDFVIYEQSDGIGGTWHDNTYPGAAVDTGVPFYSFSFHPYDFSRTYCSQAELLDYLNDLSNCYRLTSHFRFNTRVARVEWDETSHSYELTTQDGDRERFHVVVSAIGILNNPKYPEWQGLEDFRGSKFHSSRWDHSVDLKGKRVAVVGTGSTSAQIVPAIASEVEQLYVFQRQPGWMVPKMDAREFSPDERARLMHPLFRRWYRLKQFWGYDKSRGKSFIEGTKYNIASQQVCEKFIASVFQDRPDLQKMVTPDYPFGGKRPVKDSSFYPTLLRDNVELVPHAVTSLTSTGIVDETDCHREIDVLVMCTGFQPANFLGTFEVVGRDNRTIHEVWDGEPFAYLGLNVSGFPNFYMLYGPNTNGAPIMFMHERQVEFIAANLKRMIKSGVTALEVRPRVQDVFNRILRKRLSERIVAKYPDVHYYGRSPSGRDVIGWRDGMAAYSILTHTTARLSSAGRRLHTSMSRQH